VFSRIYKLLLRLYPVQHRSKFEAEMISVFEQARADASRNRAGFYAREFCGLIRGAWRSRREPMTWSVVAITRQPSAFLPMAMSLTALAVVLGSVAIFGVPHESDEGAAAHIFQLLMAGQMPVLLFFAIKWLPRAPRQTLFVLALQASAALAALAPVFFLKL
jgi:hypothetical protein